MDEASTKKLKALFEDVAGSQRGLLGLDESARLLGAVGLKTVPWRFAATADDAVAAADDLGYPVVLKVASEQIVHKSDSGGVEVGISDETCLRQAYDRIVDRVGQALPDAEIEGVTVHHQVSGVELVLGASRDPQFGPTVMVGVGGVFVELYRDVVFRIAPLDADQALAALDELRGAALLDGFRGSDPVDRDAVARALVALADLVTACPRIREVDLNPIFARHDDILAADLRILVE